MNSGYSCDQVCCVWVNAPNSHPLSLVEQQQHQYNLLFAPEQDSTDKNNEALQVSARLADLRTQLNIQQERMGNGQAKADTDFMASIRDFGVPQQHHMTLVEVCVCTRKFLFNPYPGHRQQHRPRHITRGAGSEISV